MRHLDATVLVAILASSFGCGNPASDDGTESNLGALELRLAEAPADARCLRVSFDGSHSKLSLLPLTPGSAASLLVERVPVGLVSVDAAAFDLDCRSVGSASAPTFVLESPLTVRVAPRGVTALQIALVRNGRVEVNVTFEDTGDDRAPVELAIIGDTPYGAAQAENFPELVQHINADSAIDGVVHVGDIKNGSTRCDTTYFEDVFRDFAEFATPLVYTPGDNEWTDCHRANNGAFDPLERLDTLREIFFAAPNATLGAPAAVLSQRSIAAHAAFVENRMWMKSSVVFATVHAVGSSNGLAPWFGTDTTGTRFDDPDRRIAEVEARTAAALDWIDRTFELATAQRAAGAALFMQADTFAGSTAGFEAIVTRIADGARTFGKPVLLVQGDTHTFLADRPLLAGDPAYGIEEPVPNLQRLVVQGETISEWLMLRVDPAAPGVFSWERRLLSEPDPGPGANAALLVNEVSSTPNPDWIEFVNPSSTAADVSGWFFTDNDPTHVYTFPPGTVVAPGALFVLAENVDFAFGFGSADSVVLHDATGRVVDQHSWTAHVSSNARCPDGVGPLAPASATRGLPNSCL